MVCQTQLLSRSGRAQQLKLHQPGEGGPGIWERPVAFMPDGLAAWWNTGWVVDGCISSLPVPEPSMNNAVTRNLKSPGSLQRSSLPSARTPCSGLACPPHLMVHYFPRQPWNERMDVTKNKSPWRTYTGLRHPQNQAKGGGHSQQPQGALGHPLHPH